MFKINGKSCAIASAAVMAAGIAASANADVTTPIFSEDFQGIASNKFSSPTWTRAGVPLIEDGANELWYGARFTGTGSVSASSNLGALGHPFAYPTHGNVGQMQNRRGLLFSVSTLGLSDVELSFDWTTHQASGSDRLRVGYYVGDIDFGSSRSMNLNNAGLGWGEWTELMSGIHNHGMTNATFELPSNQETVWVAFWMDAGSGKYGKIDNVVVTPAPGAAALLGLAGLAGTRRRRNRI